MNTLISLGLVTFVLALSGCGKSVEGTYVDSTGKEVTLTSGGHWTSSGGTAGTYEVDGNTVIFSGLPFGMSMTGTIDGNTLTVNEPGMGSQPRPHQYKSK